MKKQLCVIPARGGSQRLTGKNIKNLCGKPMIAWTIECAKKTGLFDHIYVSTDSEKIAEIANDYGAKTPVMLPPEIAAPDQASMSACIFMYEFLKKEYEVNWQYLFCLQPTSPLRTGKDIVSALETIEIGGYEHVVSCTPIDPHFFHWAMKQKKDKLSMWFGQEFNTDRINLPDVLRPNGAVKVMHTDCIGRHETFLDSDNVGAIMIPDERSVHIAYEIDFLLAEIMLNRISQ